MTDANTDTPTDGGQVDGAKTEQVTWYNGADDETVGYVQNKKWESPLQAVEAYKNLEKFHGVPADQLIKLPKEDTPEAWDAIYNKLGRPESADKYSEFAPSDETVALDKDAVTRFDSIFHKTGLNDKARSEILNEYANYSNEIQQQQQAAIEQERTIQIDALKKEWGQHYDERIELSKRAVRAMIPDEKQRDEAMFAIENAVGPAVVAKMFANIADKLGEDKIHSGSDSSERSFGYTKEQATSDKTILMAEIKADKKRLNDFNTGRGSDIIKLEKLNKIIAGQ